MKIHFFELIRYQFSGASQSNEIHSPSTSKCADYEYFNQICIWQQEGFETAGWTSESIEILWKCLIKSQQSIESRPVNNLPPTDVNEFLVSVDKTAFWLSVAQPVGLEEGGGRGRQISGCAFCGCTASTLGVFTFRLWPSVEQQMGVRVTNQSPWPDPFHKPRRRRISRRSIRRRWGIRSNDRNG